MTTKKKKEMREIARERGCKCKEEEQYHWFQMRDGTIGCNRCESLIITDVEYKNNKNKTE
ncbi:hypothetical protein [Bacillus thuringiensis]|uniref:Uncharacterized protein n=1 Tax=Bacillus thuringiensis TaxID=1428 RepID=A0A9X6YAF0_BACTU|nr:hypothetical protein [Bacillus thuringiensis]PEA89373.1 hypothetical protein CON71_14115 [Bacillus thuringiensis]